MTYEEARVIGTETEYGVYEPGHPHANAVELSTRAVQAYSAYARGKLAHLPPVEWDYRGEDPLNDLRGMRLARAHADPSLLTDDPYHLAPSGGSEEIPAPTAEELAQFRPTSIVLPNGGRLYVDHAHPEYSAPEVTSAAEAVLWDRAGELIAQRIMAANEEAGGAPLVLVKNNVDGKGATYGAHENYQVRRETDLDEVIRVMIPFLVTRPIYCGAGRVGLGQSSQEPGFQISQRADYIENDVGLETTFNRPIFNTRDEPHAPSEKWRRVHVIGGDANLFDVSTYLRVGTTALVLWAVEQGTDLTWEGLDLADPVGAAHEVSRDLTLQRRLPMAGGGEMSAVEIQRRFLGLVKTAFRQARVHPTPDQALVMQRWEDTLTALETDPFSLAAQVEWIGKYQLLERQRDRLQTSWEDSRLAAFDLQWSDLRPEKSLVAALAARGMVERLCSEEDLVWAADHPPADTRAAKRGRAVTEIPELKQASWTSLVFDNPERKNYRRVPLAHPTAPVQERGGGTTAK